MVDIEKSGTDSMAIWVVEILNGGYKLERFLPKNQHTQRKLLNFENYLNLSQFFFSLKNINLGAHFLLLTYFDNINF